MWNICRNCAFPQNFYTRKLGEMTVLYTVYNNVHRRCYNIEGYSELCHTSKMKPFVEIVHAKSSIIDAWQGPVYPLVLSFLLILSGYLMYSTFNITKTNCLKFARMQKLLCKSYIFCILYKTLKYKGFMKTALPNKSRFTNQNMFFLIQLFPLENKV